MGQARTARSGRRGARALAAPPSLLALLLLSAFLAFLTGLPPRASAAPPAGDAAPTPTVDALADGSETILVGVCTGTRARWDPDSHLVVTDSTFAVNEVVKGRAAKLVQLTEPGGVLPERNLGMLVPHAPRFRVGEERLLFLGRDGTGRVRVLGGDLGAPFLERAADGEARVGDQPWSALRQRLVDRSGADAGAR